MKKWFKFKMPTAFTILFLIIIILVFLSWIPAVAKTPAGIIDIFWVPMESFTNKGRASIIIFVLILGAFVNVMMKTQALDALIGKLISNLKNKELWLIPILMIFFSVSGTTYGMAEETLGFYALILPIILAAGFDAFTGLLIILLGAGIGVLGSIINPFLIGTAVQAAIDGGIVGKLAVTTGIVWRVIIWIVMTTVAIGFVMLYAYRVKKDNRNSVVFSMHSEHQKIFKKSILEVPLTKRRIVSLILFALAFVVMIFYLIAWSEFGISIFKEFGKTINTEVPYITKFIPGVGVGGLLEVSSFFLIATIIIGFVNWKSEQMLVNDILQGSSAILSVCLVIALAGGITVILQRTGMQEIMIAGIKNSIVNLPQWAIPLILYFLFVPLSFLIPSASGFATAVFSIIAPALGVGLTSGAITSFSLASGIVNLVTPTSGVVMGAIALSHISYGSLLKGLWPLLIVIMVLSIVFLVIGSLIGQPTF
ncbi:MULTISPECIES: YfcC family protein [unclassified Spiroplasma]|uniref:YfcC family protein n=1 Tax=unclassified Spiroplasma TaxID=2637901 RepID=UPI0030D4EA96